MPIVIFVILFFLNKLSCIRLSFRISTNKLAFRINRVKALGARTQVFMGITNLIFSFIVIKLSLKNNVVNVIFARKQNIGLKCFQSFESLMAAPVGGVNFWIFQYSFICVISRMTFVPFGSAWIMVVLLFLSDFNRRHFISTWNALRMSELHRDFYSAGLYGACQLRCSLRGYGYRQFLKFLFDKDCYFGDPYLWNLFDFDMLEDILTFIDLPPFLTCLIDFDHLRAWHLILLIPARFNIRWYLCLNNKWVILSRRRSHALKEGLKI